MTHNGWNRGHLALFCAGLWLSVNTPTRLMAEPPDSEKPSAAAIQEWIKQLAGSDEATHRAAAAKLQATPEAIPALRKAVASTDLTLHWRAEPLLREALYRKGRHMLEGYPIDVFLERLLRLNDPNDEEAYWRVATEFAGRIVDLEKRNFKTGFYHIETMPVYDFRKYRDKLPIPIIGPRQPLTERDEICVTRRETVQFSDRMSHAWSIIATPGSIRTGDIFGSVFLAGDSITVKSPEISMVIADGDIAATESIRASIIITRGAVRSRRDIEKSFVLSGGPVEFGTNKQKQVGRSVNSTIRERTPKLLGWVRFFETADAGIDVTAADGGVKVAKLTDGLPLAKAGLKVGDVITAVDGKPAANPETFRRLLRRGTVMDQTAFAVKRGDKALTVTASFLGWEPPSVKPAK